MHNRKNTEPKQSTTPDEPSLSVAQENAMIAEQMEGVFGVENAPLKKEFLDSLVTANSLTQPMRPRPGRGASAKRKYHVCLEILHIIFYQFGIVVIAGHTLRIMIDQFWPAPVSRTIVLLFYLFLALPSMLIQLYIWCTWNYKSIIEKSKRLVISMQKAIKVKHVLGPWVCLGTVLLLNTVLGLHLVNLLFYSPSTKAEMFFLAVIHILNHSILLVRVAKKYINSVRQKPSKGPSTVRKYFSTLFFNDCSYTVMFACVIYSCFFFLFDIAKRSYLLGLKTSKELV
ncbi:hypothetical protein NEDG_00068 [Nematocida displodere]|uniref:Uncharacterized protein n=1 Tax=Nematocida displodere TaxID=1805483 RepID=A0A177EHZ0_9MICR|nr:hypothetical protein NEDG_00068 [Nematocida displodere]